MRRPTSTPRRTLLFPSQARAGTLALAALLVAAGCDDPTEPDSALASASFEATLSGAVGGTLSGDAYSGDATRGDQLRVWGVDMDDEDGDDEIFLFVRDVRIPDPGSQYAAGPADGVVPESDEAFLLYTRRTSDGIALYESVSGTVTITDRTEERDRGIGTFQVTLVSAASDTVRVTGRFHSEEDVDGIDSLAGES